MRALLTRNPALLALFLVTFAWIAWFATRIHVYFVMPDEVRYVKQAVEIAASARPLLPGEEQFATWSQIQPLLMSPLWGLFQTPEAYRLTHWLNALIMASAVFPAYLLALRVLASRRWALAAAALTIVVPWTVMAGVMMTEVSAYPLAIWAFYGIQRAAIERTMRADALALGLLAAAFFGRTQLLVLAPVLPLVLIAQGLRYPDVAVERPTRRWLGILRDHRLVFAVAAVVALLVLVRVRTVIGNAPVELFSPGWEVFAREMLSYVVIGVGMLPLALAAAWAVGTLLRPRTPEQHAFAVTGLSAGVLLTVVIGGGSINFTAGINDRYLMYLVPLLMIGMLACLLEARPWRVLIALAGVGSAWVVWDAVLEQVGPTFVSPSAAWHMVLYGRAPQIGEAFGAPGLTSPQLMGWWVIVGCAAIALARTWIRPPIVAAVVVTIVGAYCLAETTYTRGKLEALQPAADYAEGRDWVDRALPYGAQADAVLSNLGDPSSATAVWWDLTFWNAQVTGTKRLDADPSPWFDQAFPLPFSVDAETGATSGLGQHGYVVQGAADRRFGFRGALAIGPPQGNLQLLQVPYPLAAAWMWIGPDASGFVPAGGSGTVRVFGDGLEGRRPVSLQLGVPFNAQGPSRYRLEAPGGVVERGRVAIDQPEQVAVEVRVPASGHVDLRLAAPRRQPEGADGAPAQGVQLYGALLGPPVPAEPPAQSSARTSAQ